MDSPITWFFLLTAAVCGMAYLFRQIIRELEAKAQLSADEWDRLEAETRAADFKEFYFNDYYESQDRRNRPLSF